MSSFIFSGSLHTDVIFAFSFGFTIPFLFCSGPLNIGLVFAFCSVLAKSFFISSGSLISGLAFEFFCLLPLEDSILLSNQNATPAVGMALMFTERTKSRPDNEHIAQSFSFNNPNPLTDVNCF